MFNFLASPPTRDQVVALAGIFQACALVDSYARLGTANGDGVETAIYSLLQQNSQSSEAVYRGVGNLESGFEVLEKIISNPRDTHNALVLRYAVGVLYVTRKIAKNPAMLQKIAKGIENAAKQAEHFSLTHANVVANLADLYQQTISTLKFRIQVHGVAANLQQPAIASRIRCLLFSAIRSAFLWQQLRGNRLQLMCRRNDILKLTQELRREAKSFKHS